MQQAHQTYSQRVKQITSDDSLYKVFKSDPIYTQMLEHVNQEQGNGYLTQILSREPLPLGLWKQVLANDNIGSPTQFTYHTPVGTFKISPTTLRYLHYALEFVQLAQKHKLTDNINILEIGGGYGGFCKILVDVCKHYDITIGGYTIVDLEEPIELIERYLNDNNVECNVSVGSYLATEIPSKLDFVLSYYAFSEIPEHTRELYKTNIIKPSKHGYIAWNFLPTHEIYKLPKMVTIKPEVPKTGEGNCIVTW